MSDEEQMPIIMTQTARDAGLDSMNLIPIGFVIGEGFDQEAPYESAVLDLKQRRPECYIVFFSRVSITEDNGKTYCRISGDGYRKTGTRLRPGRPLPVE